MEVQSNLAVFIDLAALLQNTAKAYQCGFRQLFFLLEPYTETAKLQCFDLCLDPNNIRTPTTLRMNRRKIARAESWKKRNIENVRM